MAADILPILSVDERANRTWLEEELPTAIDGVDIASAHSAAFNSDIDVAVLECLQLEFLLLERLPVLLALDHEAFRGIWIRHFEERSVRCWKELAVLLFENIFITVGICLFARIVFGDLIIRLATLWIQSMAVHVVLRGE